MSVLVAVANAVIFVLYLLDNHWAEERGLYCGIIFSAVVIACFSSNWKSSQGFAIVTVALSAPMALFWVKWVSRLVAYIVKGNT